MELATHASPAPIPALTCPRCGSADSRLTLLTDFGAYRRCTTCDHSRFIAGEEDPAPVRVVTPSP